MAEYDFTPNQERKLVDEFDQEESRLNNYVTRATPQLAQTVGQMYNAHPYAPVGVLLASANAVTSGMMSFDQANNLVVKASQNQLQTVVRTPKEEKKGWLDRNVWSKVRTGTRWAMAGLNFLPQVATNVLSQGFKSNPSGEGFFISTDIGTLIKNDEVAGDGWFMGGRASELQAERARRYRGEIDGHAWTIGRGFASVLTQPGSREYNILSGLVDATSAIFTPSVPGFGLAKGAVGEQLGKFGIRSLAGLTNFETAVIQTDKVASWLQSAGGRALIKRIKNISTLDEAFNTFSNVQHMDFLNKVVELNDEGLIHRYLLETLGRPIGQGDNIGKGISTIDQINISRWDDVKRTMAGRSSFVARMMASVPGQHVVLAGGNPRDVVRSVKNVNEYLKLLKVNEGTRNTLVSKFAKALVDNDGSMYKVVSEFDEIFTESMRAMGMPDEGIKQFRASMKEFVNNKDVYGAIGKNGEPTAYGARIILQDGSVVRAPSATAGLESEMLNQLSMILPDPRQVRRVMSKMGWIFGKGMWFGDDAAKQAGKLRNQIDRVGRDADRKIAALGEARKAAEAVNAPDDEIKLIDKQIRELRSATDKTVNELKQQVDALGSPKFLPDESKYGKLRIPFSALEGFQNEIWRPVTLLTGGYVLRNMTDSAFRYTNTPGLKGGMLHPIQWIQIATGKKFRGGLAGKTWKSMTLDDAEQFAKEGLDEWNTVIGQGMREALDPKEALRHSYRNKFWSKANRTSGTLYRKGIMDEVELLNRDYAARLIASGVSVDEAVEILAKDEAYLRRFQNRWANREMQLDGQPGKTAIGTPDIVDARTGQITEAGKLNIKSYIEDYISPRISEVTGQNDLLVRAIAAEDGVIRLADGTEVRMFQTGKGGMRSGYHDNFAYEVQRLIDDDAARLARGEQATLKDWYKTGVEIPVFDPNVAGRELPEWLKSWNRTTDKFFSSLYPKRSAYLMQSPVFRQYYWQDASKFIDDLDEQALVTIRNNFGELAAKEKSAMNIDWLTDYVGDRKTAQRLLDRLNNPKSGGKLSLAEVDSYAKGSALDRTKDLFYNASEKSNFADILRIAIPFGSAWAEVMNTWSKIALSNPQAARRVGVTVQGLRNADPDGDGKGFFWKDPTTGEYVFNYPFSEQIGGLAAALIPMGVAAGGVLGGLPGLVAGGAIGAGVGFGVQEATGLEATRVVAPLKSLSMGLNLYPGAGPFVQIAANKILTRTPKADFLRDIILPYGEPDITTIGPVPVPSWGRKVIDAIVSDPDNSRLLGDMTIDVMRVLHASGDYDLTKDSEKERLEDDAVSRARVLLALRGFGQLIGPTRPDIEFKVETKEGDKYTTELAKAFRDMQAENYDTAVERFITTFGEDVFLYMQGKTEARAGGLDASTKFGRFERENGSLFQRYGNVAGYFAPIGSNFDYAVYTRQIETGKREKIKPSEYIELAQQFVGRALYRSSQRQVGPDPNEYQRDALRTVKGMLQERFPGYAKITIDINAQAARINEVVRAASDPIMDDNVIAQATRQYIRYREQALNELANRGIVSGDLGVKAASDLRAYLREMADVLIRQYPEFERMYDRVFYNEVEGV